MRATAFALLFILAAAGSLADEAFNKLELFGVENLIDSRDPSQVSLSLTVTPSTLKKSGDWVEVSWDNVLQPTTTDFVAVYRAPLDLNSTPLKYKYLYSSQNHHHLSGKGSMKFRMLNMRTDIVFVYLTNGTHYPIALVESNILKMENPNEPLQGRIALGSSSSEMKVLWTTRDVGSPVVRFGLSATKLDQQLNASSVTYKASDMCGPPANASGWNVDPGYFHSAVITNLAPDTKYFYQYGSEEFGFSEVESFTSPPAVSPTASFKFFAFGDMGQADIDGSNEQAFMIASLNTTKLMGEDLGKFDDIKLLLHIGDISYARGFVSEWDVFFDQIGNTVSRRIPYMTCPGNHERDWPGSGSPFPDAKDSGGECGIAYEKRMQMPHQVESNQWYSFDFGSVHFVLMSTEQPFTKGTAQHKWIEADLASVDRKKTPWIVFSGHRPMYIDSTYSNRTNPAADIQTATELRSAFDDMFMKYKVDLALWGHHHSYQKSCPVYRKVCLGHHSDGSTRAPVHMVIGMAGYASSLGVHKYFKPLYMEKVDIVNHGYMRGSVNQTHLLMEFVGDENGSVLDTVSLYKKPQF